MAASQFWKKVGIGCGGCLGLCLISGLLVAILAVADSPKESQINELGLTESVEHNLENQAGLPGSRVGKKPIHLKIDVQYCAVKIERGEQLGSVLIEGKYDTANFKLTSDIKERDNSIDYTYTFGGSHNAFSMLFGMTQDKIDPNENTLRILLPADAPVDLEYKLSKGETQMDLTGITITGLKCETKMGDFKGTIGAPNPGRLDLFKHESKMGTATWNGLENLHAEKVRFSGRMGDINLNPLGPLTEAMSVEVDFAMGEVDVLVPQNAKVETSSSVFMGEMQKSRLQDEVPEDAPTMHVRGNITMGSLRVRRLTEFEQQISKATELALHGSIDEASQAFRDIKQKYPDDTRPDKLNDLGYRLLHRTPERAVAVFRLNVELHPHYANGYDSLGEALYHTGALEEALANYRKAYEMDPSLTTSARMIKKIKNQLNNTSDGGDEEGDPSDDSDVTNE